MFICTGITQSAAIDNIEQCSMSILKGKTLYVGGTGEGNYTTIYDALWDAGGGDTVFVYNGTYYENLCIRDKINLIGESKYTTIIDGSNSSDVIAMNTDNVKISGFTIQKSDGVGIDCMHHSNHVIEGNIIRDNPYYGIRIDKSYNGPATNNIIANNIIMNNKVGVVIGGSSPLWSGLIKNNTIYNNIISSNNVGIDFFWAEHNTIRNNNITNNNEGIILERSEYNTIRDNNIIKNLIGLNSCISITNYISKNNFIGNIRNAYFSTAWLTLSDTLKNPDTWYSNYWDNWKGYGQKIVFGGLSRGGLFLEILLLSIYVILEYEIIYSIYDIRNRMIPNTNGRKFVKIPLVQFDRFPAKEPYNIEVVI